LVSESVDAQLVESDVFGDRAVVLEHLRADAGLRGLRQLVLQHEVVQEAVQARHLVDQRHVVHSERLGRFVDRHLRENLWPELIHVHDQVLELLFVHLEVLHS
jgi:hypothetical protein